MIMDFKVISNVTNINILTFFYHQILRSIQNMKV